MPTIVTSTIGAGGDYSTLQAWEDACPANLVTSDQVWVGEVLWSSAASELYQAGGTILTVSGITTDATRYVWLKAASGASFRDNATVDTNHLRYNADNGACIRVVSDYARTIDVSSNYFRVSDLQIYNGSGGTYGSEIIGEGVVIENCIFGATSTWSPILFISCSDAAPPTVRNCLFCGANSPGVGIRGLYQSAIFVNNTFIYPSNLGSGSYALATGYSQYVKIYNNAFFGYANIVYDGAFYSSFDVRNNATDKASLGFTPATNTGNLLSVVYADQFENPSNATPSTFDCRTKSGADLIDAGMDTSSRGVTTDIIGTTRGATYDIGAWEVTSAGTVLDETVSDTTSATETVAGGVAILTTITDTPTAADSAAGALVIGSSLVDTISAAETLGRIVSVHTTISDTTAGTEVLGGAGVGVTAATTDHTPVVDLLVAMAAVSVAISDSATTAEGVAGEIGSITYSETIAGLVAPVELVLTTVVVGAYISDLTTGSDLAPAVVTTPTTLTDAVGGTESVSVSIVLAVTVNEGVSVADSAAVVVLPATGEAVADAVSTADAVGVAVVVLASLSEFALANDSTAGSAGVVASLSDGLVLLDTVVLFIHESEQPPLVRSYAVEIGERSYLASFSGRSYTVTIPSRYRSE